MRFRNKKTLMALLTAAVVSVTAISGTGAAFVFADEETQENYTVEGTGETLGEGTEGVTVPENASPEETQGEETDPSPDQEQGSAGGEADEAGNAGEETLTPDNAGNAGEEALSLDKAGEEALSPDDAAKTDDSALETETKQPETADESHESEGETPETEPAASETEEQAETPEADGSADTLKTDGERDKSKTEKNGATAESIKDKASAAKAKTAKLKSEKAKKADDASETPVIGAAAADASAPKYDPRLDFVSQIRDQYWGTCWAQAGIANIESFLIRHSMEDKSYQLSVEDALWWARGTSQKEEGYGWVLRDRDASGFAPAMTGFLTTAGVRLESDIPYLGEPADGKKDDFLVFGEGQNQKPANFDTAPVQYEVTDIVYTKKATIQQVKEQIAAYGAVSATYKDTGESMNKETSAIWEPFTGEGANHFIAVVGWDDNFPKENFKKHDGKLPQNNGAWIVKNSYGTKYGSDGGFVYISYEDGYLFKDEGSLDYSYSVAGARKPTGQKRYMHDQFGAIQSIDRTGNGTAVWANVFDFGKDERINELSFVSWAAGSEYKMYYAPMNGDAPNSDESTWKLLSEGKIGHSGYTTVSSTLNEAVPEGKGAIIFSVTGAMQSVGTDEPGYVNGQQLRFNSIPDKGTAFELKDGKFVKAEVQRTVNGNTYMEEPNLSIRAYTVPYTPEPSPEPTVTPEPTATVTPEPTATVTPVPTSTPSARPSVVPASPSKAPVAPGTSGKSTTGSTVKTGDESFPIWGYGLIIGGAAAVIVILLVLYLRKRK